MYRCNTCKTTFDEPKEISADIFYGDYDATRPCNAKITVCPYCGNCGIEEITTPMFKSNKKGTCPFCGEEDLEYGAVSFEGDFCYFPWECNCCGEKGEEWYELSFAGHNVIVDGENIEIDESMIK